MEQNNKHTKKMIAPVIIVSLLVAYYLFFFTIVLLIPGLPLVVKLLFGIVPLLIAGVAIYVLIERINEIRSGEEDDLSNY